MLSPNLFLKVPACRPVGTARSMLSCCDKHCCILRNFRFSWFSWIPAWPFKNELPPIKVCIGYCQIECTSTICRRRFFLTVAGRVLTIIPGGLIVMVNWLVEITCFFHRNKVSCKLYVHMTIAFEQKSLCYVVFQTVFSNIGSFHSSGFKATA